MAELAAQLPLRHFDGTKESKSDKDKDGLAYDMCVKKGLRSQGTDALLNAASRSFALCGHSALQLQTAVRAGWAGGRFCFSFGGLALLLLQASALSTPTHQAVLPSPRRASTRRCGSSLQWAPTCASACRMTRCPPESRSSGILCTHGPSARTASLRCNHACSGPQGTVHYAWRSRTLAALLDSCYPHPWLHGSAS